MGLIILQDKYGILVFNKKDFYSFYLFFFNGCTERGAWLQNFATLYEIHRGVGGLLDFCEREEVRVYQTPAFANSPRPS